MKVGIVTINNNDDEPNYGNVLQLYALNKYISTRDKANEVVTFRFRGFYNYNYIGNLYKKIIFYTKNLMWEVKLYLHQKRNNKNEVIAYRKKQFREFLFCQGIHEETVKNRKLSRRNCDVVIVGSDVVWEQRDFCINRQFFLDFKGCNNIVKASYAASFGSPNLSNANKKEIKRLLSDFDYVSVRENTAVDLLSSIGIGAVQVLDSTFLINENQWREISKKPKTLKESDEFIFAYILGNDDTVYSNIIKYARKRDLKVVTIKYATGWAKNTSYNGDLMELSKCSPEEFLWLVDHAKKVVTDSFHGIALSINMHSQFIALRRGGATELNDRITNILKLVEREDLLLDVTELEKSADRLILESNLEQHRNAAKEYIDKIMVRCDRTI